MRVRRDRIKHKIPESTLHKLTREHYIRKFQAQLIKVTNIAIKNIKDNQTAPQTNAPDETTAPETEMLNQTEELPSATARNTENAITADEATTTNEMDLDTAAPFTMVRIKSQRTSEGAGNTAKKPRMDARDPKPFTTTNRFAPLTVTDDDAAPDDAGTAEDSTNSPRQASKTPKNLPPPIVIYGKANNNAQFIKFIETTVKKGFKIKYTNENTNIHINDATEWKSLKSTLSENKLEFHSYTHRDEKTHAFVLRGLDHAPPPEMIVRELRELHGVEVTQCYTMNKTRRPAYLVITKSDTTLTKISKIRALEYTMVTWQRYQNNKKIIQCHRCQAWGHATSNCFAAPKCLKCAEGHLTTNCTKTDKDTPAKCVNCGGPHPANNVECTVYLQKLKAIQNNIAGRQQQPRKPPNSNEFPALRYRPAPSPATNSWKAAAHSTATQQQHLQQQQQQQESARVQKGEANEISELTSELNSLNEMINVSAMLAAVKDLNSKLRLCKSALEKFTVFNSFAQNLSVHGL